MWQPWREFKLEHLPDQMPFGLSLLGSEFFDSYIGVFNGFLALKVDSVEIC